MIRYQVDISSGGSGDSEHSDIRKTVGDLLDSTKELKGLKLTLGFVQYKPGCFCTNWLLVGVWKC